MKADHLEPAALRVAALTEHPRGARRQRAVGVGLDLELQRQVGRQQVEQRHFVIATFEVAAADRHDQPLVLAQPAQVGVPLMAKSPL